MGLGKRLHWEHKGVHNVSPAPAYKNDLLKCTVRAELYWSFDVGRFLLICRKCQTLSPLWSQRWLFQASCLDVKVISGTFKNNWLICAPRGWVASVDGADSHSHSSKSEVRSKVPNETSPHSSCVISTCPLSCLFIQKQGLILITITYLLHIVSNLSSNPLSGYYLYPPQFLR